MSIRMHCAYKFTLDVFHQVYEEYAEQADMWLASKEAFLANEDLGVSRSKDVHELAAHNINL